jgi:endonuclease/exonuclease/phosphatase family metal-dependent hydrolase
LQVEVTEKDPFEHVLTVFICHFKSKYSQYDRFTEKDDYEKDQKLNTVKRTAEVEKVVEIVKDAVDVENDLFVVLGDFNDTPGSDPLQPLLGVNNELGLMDALTLIDQADNSATSTVRRNRDTHCWVPPVEEGEEEEDEWSQFDYILCSKKLWEHNTGLAEVVNEPKEQGSDHYLSYVEFDL